MSRRAAAVCAALIGLLAAPAGAFETVCLPGEYQGDGLRLVVDAVGTLHLARVGRVDGALRYTTIGPDGAFEDTVLAPFMTRLAVDDVRDLGLAESDAGLHVCAYDAVRRSFDVYDRAADGQWARTALDAGQRIGESCALAALDDGLLVAWHGDGILRAAHRPAGGDWQTVDVDTAAGADVGRFPSIAVHDGVVVIAHLDVTAEVLRVSAAVAAGPLAEWDWQTTALDAGGWRPAAFFADATLHVYHGRVPLAPDRESDGGMVASDGPPFGPFRTVELPGDSLGGSLDAVGDADEVALFVRRRTRSALFGAFDGLYLDRGPPGGVLERETIAESGPGGRRHAYQHLQVERDPFGLPVLAWFDDASAGLGQPAQALTCYARALDSDADRVPDEIERALGTDPAAADTDGDGRTDGEEILIDGTDPGEQVCGDEVCNGRDDDCDARTDEGLDGGACPTGAEGVCAVGRQVCLDGALVCAPQVDAGDEACSGLDDDCDGAVDEGRQACGAGRCRAEAPLCVDGAPGECVPAEPAPDDGQCDGVDDDCDGAVDEAYVGMPSVCGVGRCRAEGTIRCLAGQPVDDCAPAAPAADDRTCDGEDDDCDGAVDEDAAPIAVRCGVGACAADGVVECVEGSPVERCTPGEPAALDPCDGVDDDCDGRIDEDHVVEGTACGAGPCAAVGERICDRGALRDTCRPGDGGPDDTCDGVDDDCDGAVDEGFGAVSTCGLGPCRAVADVRCVAGVAVDRCAPRAPLGPDDTCDGVDDDCDGAVDEAYAERASACGVGACAAEGVVRCDGGLVLDDCNPGGPPAPADADCDGVDDDCDGAADEGAECDCPPDEPGCGCLADDTTCDGVDDDCDGAADEGHGVRPLSCGVGACAAEGVGRCVDGALVVECVPGESPGDDDDCDGVDDDCDGATDEAFPAGEIQCGTGICAAVGTVRCVEGRVIERCRPGPGRGDDPICNGLDDDCDGTVDEGAAREPITCGVGACAAEGLRSCRRGRFVDRCFPGAPAADDATCDGLDDDCDGAVDEDVGVGETLCGVGACAAFGTVRCVDGALRDDCAPAAAAADDATCDGLDDDCDGAADEDYAPRAIRCGVGACAAAADSACVEGVEVDRCAPGQPAADDARCDGVDGDCDGAIDEDAARAPITCGRGACLQAGERRCAGGALVEDCTPGEPGPFDAECDGIDADCDGALDEDFVGPEQRCGVGACARTARGICVDGQIVDGPCVAAAAGVEACDGLDGDCDGLLDESCVAPAPDGGALDAGVAEPVDAAVDAESDAAAVGPLPDGDPSDAARSPRDVGVVADGMAIAPDDSVTLPRDGGMPPDDSAMASDAVADAMTDTSPVAADVGVVVPSDTGVALDATFVMRDAMLDGPRGPSRVDGAVPDGGLDRPDAVRLDYALDPLEDLVPDREFGCFARIAPERGPSWPLWPLGLGAMLIKRRQRQRRSDER